MTQLVLINLAIHRFWTQGKQGSPVPRDTYINLGYYLSQPNSLVVVEPSFTDAYLAFLELHGRRGKILRVMPSARAEHWASAVAKGLPSTEKIGSFLFAGSSDLESELVNALAPGLKLDPPVADARRLNRKTTLLKITRDLNLPMPPSEEVRADHAEVSFPGPYLLKPDLGQSGSGQMVSDKPPIEFLRTADRLTNQNEGESVWLLQKFLDVKQNISLFGEDVLLHGAFRVEYDPARVSRRHTALPNEPFADQAAEIYSRLAKHLKAKFKYTGPFGVDAIVDSRDQLYPAIDLNARLDKSRMIHEAAQHFSIPSEEIDSHSLRLPAEEDFAPWWKTLRSKLGLDAKGEAPDGGYFYPYFFNGLEVSFFAGRKGFRPEMGENPWLEKIYEALKKA